MYIAFKWLVRLAAAMWVAMCFTNMMLIEDKIIRDPGLYPIQFGLIFKNISKLKDSKSADRENNHYLYNKEQSMSALHLMMFVAGALAISVFNKRREIVRFTNTKLLKMYGFDNCVNFKYPAIKFGVVVTKYLLTFWEKIKTYGQISLTYISLNALKTTHSLKQRKLYTLMLTKLKEIGEERKHLGQLLMSAIQENKNIRMQYQLEALAKTRLAKHIENTNRHLKENQSKYVSFQHLYLVTHQENIFLKAQITKITKDKEDVEKNLMALINEVYKTKNNELKSYCRRYIVKTKRNLLNSDVGAEIQHFLRRSHNTSAFSFITHPERSRIEISSTKISPHCSGIRITEVLQDNDIVPLVSDSPKLKGLPGEYVWTIKDKDGIIEKLYEYDSEFDVDSGDTIRKIRQYSVYYDKDCLIDFTKSFSEHEMNSENFNVRYNSQNVNPFESRRIVSDSEAFKQFLRNNKSYIMPSLSQNSAVKLRL